jgi:hypothetical protein
MTKEGRIEYIIDMVLTQLLEVKDLIKDIKKENTEI